MNNNQGDSDKNKGLPDDFYSDADINNDKDFFNEESPEEKEKRKKFRRIILAIIGVVVVALIGIYVWGVIFYRTHFFPRTDINGIDVGLQTVDAALNTIKGDLAVRQLEIEGNDGLRDTVTSSQIDLTFDNEVGDLEKMMHDQDEFFWEMHSIFRNEIEMHTFYNYDEEKMDALVNSLAVVSSPSVVPPQDATISYDGSVFVINPSVDGDQPNKEKLIDAILKNLIENNKILRLSEAHIYNKPAITKDDETLKEDLEELNKAIGAVITLNFPGQQIVLDKNIFNSWLGYDGSTITLNQDLLNTYVSQLAQQFNNNGANISFKAHNGNTYTFKNNSGWELNQQEEANQLRSKILEGAVETIDPVWAHTGNQYLTGTSLVNNYIEVSLANQTLWYYKNGAMVSYSTIVSGNLASRSGTPTGLFFIQSKDTNVNLVVRQVDGSTINTQVRYWLPFSTNLGIESATWRTEFGGNIYQNQGTDGDIDVPEDMAQTLYNNVDTGYPVVIY